MASLGELFVTVGANVQGFKDAMTDVSTSVDTVNKDIDKKLLGGLASIGTAAIAAGLAIDDAFDRIAIGTGASGPLLASLQASFSNVFGATPVSSQDASTAITDLHTKLGLVGTELEKTATQMLNLSRITGTDVKPVITDATRLFGDWSIATSKQATALDTIFKISQSTGTEIGLLMTAVVQFGAPLRALGFDFDTATALVGKFQQEGVNTELVLGSLRIALGRMAKEGIVDAKAGLDSIIASITNAKTPAEATRLAIEAFGAKAGPDMAIAIREGRFELDGLFKKLADSTVTINAAATATDGFKESLTLAKNQATLLLEPLGTGLLGALNGIMAVLIPVVEKFRTLSALFNMPIFGGFFDEAKAAKDKAAELHPELTKVTTATQNVATASTTAAEKIEKARKEMEEAKKKAEALKLKQEALKKATEELKAAYSKLGLQNVKKEADELKGAIDLLKKSGNWNRLSVDDQKAALDKLEAAEFKAKNTTYDFELKLFNLTQQLKPAITEANSYKLAMDLVDQAIVDLNADVTKLPLGMINAQILAQTASMAAAAGQTVILKTAYDTLGIESQADLKAIADKAVAARDAIMGSDLATDWEKKTAIYKALKAQVDYAKQVGIDVPADQAAALKAMGDELDKPKTGLPNIKSKFETLKTEVSTIITNFAQSISDSLWDGKMSWGEKGKTLLTDLGKAVTSSFITPAVTAITGFVTNTLNGLLGGALDGISTKFGKIFGGGAADAVTGGGGASIPGADIGAGAGAGAGGGVGSVMGAIGAVSGVVGAVSGVIGNFQMSYMNSSLGLIEESTRYTKGYLLNILDKINLHLPGIDVANTYFRTTLNTTITSLLTETETIKTTVGGIKGVLDLMHAWGPWSSSVVTVKVDLGDVSAAIWDAAKWTVQSATERAQVGWQKLADIHEALRSQSGGVTIQIQGNVIGTDDAAQTFADIIAGKLALQGGGG